MELKDQLKARYKQARTACEQVVTYYGGDPKEVIEIRHLEKLDRILDAESPREADDLAKRAEDSVFITVLNLVARHKLPGANTPNVWDDRARKAESLARYFEKEANNKFVTCEEGGREKMLAKAEKQRQRAIKLREYAEKLKSNPNLPRPDFTDEEQAEPTPVVELKPKKKGRAKVEPPPPVVEKKPKRERRIVGLKPGARKRTA